MLHAGSLAPLFFLLLALTAPAVSQAPDRPPQDPAPVPLTQEQLGDLAMLRQQYVAAIDFYRRGPQNSATIWNKLGMAWHHLFAMDEARRDYEHALALRPDFPEALNNLGAVYYARKNYGKAVKLYRKAVALDPTSAPMYSNLGTAYLAERKTRLGLAAYQKAFALDPAVFEDSALLVDEVMPATARAQQDYCIARVFAESGKLGEALDYLRRALNEGFADRKKLFQDGTLSSLRATPEFSRLLTEMRLP